MITITSVGSYSQGHFPTMNEKNFSVTCVYITNSYRLYFGCQSVSLLGWQLSRPSEYRIHEKKKEICWKLSQAKNEGELNVKMPLQTITRASGGFCSPGLKRAWRKRISLPIGKNWADVFYFLSLQSPSCLCQIGPEIDRLRCESALSSFVSLCLFFSLSKNCVCGQYSIECPLAHPRSDASEVHCLIYGRRSPQRE